ncbi:hypothetical protein PN823_004573 [Enterobacter hormaechei]|nr:hypothetical protein [Enterobacter hormaechei]
MKRTILLGLSILLLAGCSTSASRMRDCERQGISRDTCYLAEQNRQSSSHAARLAVAEQMINDDLKEDSHKHHHHHH